MIWFERQPGARNNTAEFASGTNCQQVILLLHRHHVFPRPVPPSPHCPSPPKTPKACPHWYRSRSRRCQIPRKIQGAQAKSQRHRSGNLIFPSRTRHQSLNQLIHTGQRQTPFQGPPSQTEYPQNKNGTSVIINAFFLPAKSFFS